MTCDRAREAILEADPSDLRGEGDGNLSLHLRECEACRRRAQAVLAAEDGLAAEMEALVPRPDLDHVILVGTAPRPGLLEFRTGIKGRVGAWTRWARRAPFRAAFPLAAAAAFAALLLLREPSLPGPQYTLPVRSPGLGVEVPPGQNVAVLATNDPNITVLWLF
jgi:hypothetical protein